jgi:hypothetical protein
MGAPVFERCEFENIWVSGGHAAYGALFLECRCRGTIKGINFGFSDHGGFHPDSMIKHNMQRALAAPFCLDITEATCTSLCFDSQIFAEKIRFRERQCLILSAGKLREVANDLFRSTKDKSFQLLLIGAMQGTTSERAIALVEQSAEQHLDEYISAMKGAGIIVRTSPLC